jgi:hypothetical protein
MRKEMDDLARRLNIVQNDVRGVQNDVRDVIDNVSEVKNDVREVKDEVKQVKLTQEEMACITKEATERSEWFTGKQKIFVCGGNDGKTNFNSVESYSWPENSWTMETAMKETRSAPSAFAHGREIYVSGGSNGSKVTDSIETLNVDEEHFEWRESPVTMPLKCRGHKMVCHQNSAILTGGDSDGDNVSDGIYEISLDPPHNSKLLTRMPEPRCLHGCEIVDNQAGAPEPRGQRGQLPPLPKQCGGSTGAAGCLFSKNCTSNVVRFSHELKLKTVFKQFSSYLNLNSSQKRYESVST